MSFAYASCSFLTASAFGSFVLGSTPIPSTPPKDTVHKRHVHTKNDWMIKDLFAPAFSSENDFHGTREHHGCRRACCRLLYPMLCHPWDGREPKRATLAGQHAGGGASSGSGSAGALQTAVNDTTEYRVLLSFKDS